MPRFSKHDADRVARATKVSEKRIQGGDPGRGRYPAAASMPAGRLAKTKSPGIAAAAGSYPGEATIDLWTLDETSGAMSDSGEDITALNVFADAVAGNTLVIVIYVEGWWVVIGEACPT